MIGFTYNSAASASADPYNFYHWTQWSTTATPAAGNILQSWVSYYNWDTLASNTTTATSTLNTQATTTWASAISASTVY